MSVRLVERPSISTRSAQGDDQQIKLLAYLGLVLCIIGFWMILRPYERIVADSILYAFSALARLHPRSLGRDIYLTIGTQDRYTIFSPLVAPLIREFGLARAASLVTFVSQLAFFGCGWLLARRFMPAAQALLALALLVVLPATYGQGHVFSYAEVVMTPRLPSEVLVLCALIAVIGRRFVLGAACLIGATVLHPIMAAAGFVTIFMLLVGNSRPRLAAAIAVGSFVALICFAFFAPVGPIKRIDAGWFNFLYSGGSYLFPSKWGLTDWAHASVPLSILAVGCLPAVDARVRSICLATLVAGVSGVLVSLAGSDWLRILIIAQAQPWRWLWLANALAVIVTPAVVGSCWRGKGATPSAAVLLVAAWVCIDQPYVLIIALSAILLALIGRHVNDPRRTRLLLAGCCAVLILALWGLSQFMLGVIADLAHIPPERSLYTTPYLLELRTWKTWLAGGVVPAGLFLGAWWIATHRKKVASQLAVLALGMALCAACAQFSWNAWVRWPQAQFSKRLFKDFAPWRRAIPESAQVFWSNSAVPIWFLLHRASYASREQTSASVFSERLAREIALRRLLVSRSLKSTVDPHKALVRLCRNNPALGYFVTRQNAGPTPYPLIKNPKGPGMLRLYRCAAFRA